MPQFLVRPDAIEGARVRFDAAETRHLARVLRLRPGARLEVTDGAGRTLAVQLDALGPGMAWGTIVAEAAPSRESPCAITLAQAILKGARMSWLIQKATELGVARIVPVETARVVARPSRDQADDRRRRWERVARAAVKQCGRVVTPAIDPPRAFAAVVREARGYDVTWLFRESGGRPVASVAREGEPPRRLLLLIGPEGGFTAAEVALAESAGARVVGLGPRTLRAESAALVAVALGQHLFGDLGQDDGVPSC